MFIDTADTQPYSHEKGRDDGKWLLRLQTPRYVLMNKGLIPMVFKYSIFCQKKLHSPSRCQESHEFLFPCMSLLRM
jgi:hypothetical protein